MRRSGGVCNDSLYSRSRETERPGPLPLSGSRAALSLARRHQPRQRPRLPELTVSRFINTGLSITCTALGRGEA